MITIKGTQFADDEQDSVELTTVGRLYRRGEAYYICYNESEATGFDGANKGKAGRKHSLPVQKACPNRDLFDFTIGKDLLQCLLQKLLQLLRCIRNTAVSWFHTAYRPRQEG